MDKFLMSSVPIEQLLLQFRSIIREEIENEQKKQVEAQLLSPAETCNLFQPKISKVTLHKWTQEGRLQEYRIGGRVYYKYSEVMSSLQTLRKYKRA